MGSMELSTTPENGTAAPANGGVERRLRSSALSVSWASHLLLEVGTGVMCRWRDQKPHPVKVIERRKSSSYSSPDNYEFYAHYTEFNRRLDEWIKLKQLDLVTIEADVDEKVEDKQGHKELDTASGREYEEFTKVKNIANIELGKYDIDTWYFFPFPPEYNDSAKLFFW